MWVGCRYARHTTVVRCEWLALQLDDHAGPIALSVGLRPAPFGKARRDLIIWAQRRGCEPLWAPALGPRRRRSDQRCEQDQYETKRRPLACAYTDENTLL